MKDENIVPDLPKQFTSKLINFIGKDIRAFWHSVRDNLPLASPEIQALAEKLPEIFAAIELDDNRRNQREIYLAIANFLKVHLHQPLPLCLNTVHILCHENNPDIKEDGAIGGAKLIESAKELIVTVRVHYEQQDAGIYNRKIEIYFLKDDLRKVQKVQEILDWDSLPQDIRDTLLRQQQVKPFILYPKAG